MGEESRLDKGTGIAGGGNKRGPGAPRGNFNAWKHGKFSRRRGIVLTCRICAAAERCVHRNAQNPDLPCVYERKLAGVKDLTTIDGLKTFLRELIELDYGRYCRGLIFEVLGGGLLDSDLTRLAGHIRAEIQTLGRLMELGELEERVRRLETILEERG